MVHGVAKAGHDLATKEREREREREIVCQLHLNKTVTDKKDRKRGIKEQRIRLQITKK